MDNIRVGISDLLKSKRFYVLLLGLVIMLVSTMNNDVGQWLTDNQDQIIALIAILIGGYSVEDAIFAYRVGTTKYTKE